jgi:3-deoxy-D-manno-octulosonic-acid transferase
MLLNAVYLLAWLFFAPWLYFKSLTTGKYRRGWKEKLLGLVPRVTGPDVVWFHGVSVGEVHLLRPLIARFRELHPEYQCIVSATTDTGHAEACKHFPDMLVIYWPFDFTWAVRTALRRVNPRLVVLAEGELWPNFLQATRRAGIATAVVNGRMSPRSAGRFLRLGWLARRLFGRVDLIAAQSPEFADSYRKLGASNVVVTGNIKYDGVRTERDNPRTRVLRQLFGLSADDIVWVAGSTQHPEEAHAIDIYRRASDPRLRLIIVPRHPERFDEAARLLEQTRLPWVHRSQLPAVAVPDRSVILVDTMGELGAVWGLADIAYVGGSLDGKRGGQNMIEPAAYGAAVVFGPHTWNFRQTVASLKRHAAALEVASAAALETAVLGLLGDAKQRERLGTAAREFVLSQQGATLTTVHHLECLLGIPRPQSRAA